jgi:DNA-directed RNA polymerase specialized sigma24 family protein
MSSDGSVTRLLGQLQEGSPEAVALIWQRYFHRLVGLARKKLHNAPRRAADEEDVALSAFDSFCQGATRGRFPQLNDRGDLWRLLVTITARKACKQSRHDHRQKRGGNAVLDEAALHEAAEEYERLLALLPDADMRDLAQWKMEGFTNDEIATRLGCTVRSVERRLRLIRILWSQEEQQ